MLRATLISLSQFLGSLYAHLTMDQRSWIDTMLSTGVSINVARHKFHSEWPRYETEIGGLVYQNICNLFHRLL